MKSGINERITKLNFIEYKESMFFENKIIRRPDVVTWTFKRGLETNSLMNSRYINWNEILFATSSNESIEKFDFMLIFIEKNFKIYISKLCDIKKISGKFIYMTGPFQYNLNLLNDIGFIKNNNINYNFFCN